MYDCIVVGAGIIGACAAYDLVKKGKKTLVIDQVSSVTNRRIFQGFELKGKTFERII